jgi:hypothetical protein
VIGSAQIIQADARQLPLADDSVDLICTSPPYFALSSYQDAARHYAGQLGSEPTPAEFVDALIEVTAECVRVLKPSGSLWVNLGDKYAQGKGVERRGHRGQGTRRGVNTPNRATGDRLQRRPSKSLSAFRGVTRSAASTTSASSSAPRSSGRNRTGSPSPSPTGYAAATNNGSTSRCSRATSQRSTRSENSTHQRTAGRYVTGRTGPPEMNGARRLSQP